MKKYNKPEIKDEAIEVEDICIKSSTDEGNSSSIGDFFSAGGSK